MENKEDLFDLKLDQEGRSNLGKVFRLAKASFWAGLLVELFILFYSLRDYFRNSDFEIQEGEVSSYYWALRIYTIYAVLFSSLVILQGYYLLQFSRQGKRSIEMNDSFSFNKSFAWMRKTLIVGLVLIFLNALYFLQLFFWEG